MSEYKNIRWAWVVVPTAKTLTPALSHAGAGEAVQ
jgi:hypothetical protein